MDEKAHILSPEAKRILIFWTRMLGWITFSCILPITTFAIRFGLFEKNTVRIDSLGNVIESQSTSLNGWGIIACAIVGLTISSIVKNVIAAYPGYSLTKQWLHGFRKVVLPLLVGFFVCLFIHNVIHHLMFCLGTLAVCQFIAIPLNPLPKWRYEKAGIEEYSSALDFLTKSAKRKSSDSKGGGVNG